MGCTPEELASAHRDAAAGSPGHLDRLEAAQIADAVKRAPRIAMIGSAPPRVTP
jgi:hypothetical protein